MEDYQNALLKAGKLTDLLNSASVSKTMIGKALTNEHRYLQQEFWTMVESFITESASKHAEGKFDDRNAYTVKMCAKIAPLFETFRMEIAGMEPPIDKRYDKLMTDIRDFRRENKSKSVSTSHTMTVTEFNAIQAKLRQVFHKFTVEFQGEDQVKVTISNHR